MATSLIDPSIAGVNIVRNTGTSTVVSATLDCGTYNVDVSETGALEMVQVPAGAFVEWVALEVVTPETDSSNTVTFDVGDGSDTDGWLDGVDAETAGVSVSSQFTLTEGTPNTVSPAYTNGKFYSAADTIDVLPSHDLDDAKIVLTVKYTVIS